MGDPEGDCTMQEPSNVKLSCSRSSRSCPSISRREVVGQEWKNEAGKRYANVDKLFCSFECWLPPHMQVVLSANARVCNNRKDPSQLIADPSSAIARELSEIDSLLCCQGCCSVIIGFKSSPSNHPSFSPRHYHSSYLALPNFLYKPFR